MWIILALAMVEYFAISIFIPIDPYASKGNKRLKRFIRMVLWLLTDFIVYYQIKKWDELVVYLMISTFFTVKYLLEIFNPYLGDMYLLGVFSGGMSYYLWTHWYERHPVIACIIFIVLACGTLVTWKEDISFMIQRLDADIEEDIRIQESARKKKRKKSISKLVWFLIKAWRI